MMEAVEFVLKDNFSIRAAANAKEVPFQILHPYIKKKKSNPKHDIKMQPHYDVLRYLPKNKSVILLTISVLSTKCVMVY
jgi:hypothetical protein